MILTLKVHAMCLLCYASSTITYFFKRFLMPTDGHSGQCYILTKAKAAYVSVANADQLRATSSYTSYLMRTNF